MAKKSLPDPEVLRKLLRYDPETGKLFWRERGEDFFEFPHLCDPWNKRYAGKEALTASAYGYKIGSVLGSLMRAHRVIWAMQHGEWPNDHIDHINGVRSDNRISNLRVVTCLVNRRNSARSKTNTSGVTGVYFNKKEKRWRATIGKNGRLQWIGSFERFEDAVRARKKAEKDRGYHPNHGRPQ